MNLEIVHVEWVDSMSIHKWNFHDKVDDFAKSKHSPCHSSGFLIYENDEQVVLAQSICEDCKADAIKIPKVAVLNIKRLATAEIDYLK